MINKPQKDIKKPSPATEELPKPKIVLKDLFKESDDPIQAAADRARRFGRTPTNNTDPNGSFRPK